MDGEEKPLYENKIKEMEQRHASVLEGLRKEISTVQNQYNGRQEYNVYAFRFIV